MSRRVTLAALFIAAAAAMAVPPYEVPLDIVRVFASAPEGSGGRDLDRTDVVGGSTIDLAIAAESPNQLATTVDRLGERVAAVVDGSTVEPTEKGARVRLPVVEGAAASRLADDLFVGGRLELRVAVHDSPLVRAAAAELKRNPVRGVGVEHTAVTGPSNPDVFFVAASRERLAAALAALTPGPGREFLIRDNGPPGSRHRFRSLYVEKNVELTNADVATAEFSYNQALDAPEVLVELTPDGAQRFADLTAAHVGDMLVVVVDGEIISTPVILGAVPGGAFVISVPAESAAEGRGRATALAQVLATTAALPPLRVGAVTEHPPTVANSAVAAAWLAFACVCGLLGFAALRVAEQALRQRAPVAQAHARTLPGATTKRPWRRLLVTAGGVVAVWAGGWVLLPTLNGEEVFALLAVGDGPVDTRAFSVLTLGIAPFIEAAVLIELVALCVPAWRRRRHDPPFRRGLERAAVVLGLSFAALQGFFLASWLDNPMFASMTVDLIAQRTGFRTITTLTIVAGSAGALAIARLIDRFGLGNGVSAVLVASIAVELAAAVSGATGPSGSIVASGALSDPLRATAGLLVAGLLTAWVVRSRVGGLRLPAGSVAPLAVLSVVGSAFAFAASRGWSMPEALLSLFDLASWSSLVVVTVIASSVFSWLLSRASPVSRANLASTAYVLALLGLAHLTMGPAAFVGAAVATAVLLDGWDEWVAWRRHGTLVAVRDEHRIQQVDALLYRLAEAGIPAHARGAHHRSLLHVFGPYVPVSLMVPADRASSAARVLADEDGPAPAPTEAAAGTDAE